jgi:hypothetical protein
MPPADENPNNAENPYVSPQTEQPPSSTVSQHDIAVKNAILSCSYQQIVVITLVVFGLDGGFFQKGGFLISGFSWIFIIAIILYKLCVPGKILSNTTLVIIKHHFWVISMTFFIVAVLF